MQNHKRYHSYLVESLSDPLEAAAYLDAVFEDGDAEHILVALRNVAEARSLTTSIHTGESNSDWNKVIERITAQDVSELSVITELLNTFGLRLSVATREDPSVEAA